MTDTGPLPSSVDVVVIGAGIVGACTALSLAERGARVLLCEKGEVAGEASGRAFGLVSNAFMSPRKLPLLARSQGLWAEMEARVEHAIDYRRTGFHFIFSAEPMVAFARDWVDQTTGQEGIDVRLTQPADIMRLSPEAAAGSVGGLLQQNAATIEPRLAGPAIVEAAKRLGASVVQNCAAHSIKTEGTHVTGISTEHGDVLAPNVVVSAGIWSAALLRHLGLSLPTLQAWASIASIAPLDGPTLPASVSGVNYRREGDGGYTINTLGSAAPLSLSALAEARRLLPLYDAMSSQIELVLSGRALWDEVRQRLSGRGLSSVLRAYRILQPAVHTQQIEHVVSALKALAPFSGATVREAWAGAVCTTADNMPVISAVEPMKGLYVGSGMYNGLAEGPAAGEALADLVEAKPARIDLSPYRFGRFSDGSAIQFQL